jgi:hypothetical protein
MPYPGWSPKQIRMYKHIKDSGASKAVAAATVNKHKAKGKKKRGR